MLDFEKNSSVDKVDTEKQVHIGEVEENASSDGLEVNASGHVCFIFLAFRSFWPGLKERLTLVLVF